MSSVQRLREVVRERLAAAAEEICGEFEKMIFQYEEEIKYQQRLLEITWRPKIKLHRIGFPQHPECKRDEVLPDQQLWNQQRNSVVDQQEPEAPQMKEEQEERCTSQEGEVLAVKLENDSLTVTPVSEENNQGEAEPISEQQDEEGSQHVDSGSAEEEPRTKKRRLTNRSHSNIDDHCLTSKIHDEDKTDDLQLHECNKEEVLAAQLLWDQERNSSLDQEDQDPAQVKVEEEELSTGQEKEQIKLKQESDTCMTTPAFEENDGETKSNSKQLLFYCSPDSECEDQGACKNVKSGLNKHEEPKKKEKPQIKKHQKSQTADETKVCDISGKRFSQKCDLLEHMRNHTGEKLCSCEICLKKVTECGQLRKHMEMHQDVRQYPCETCGKKFTKHGNLKIHVRIHTGERPYLCTTCGQSFTKCDHLQKHMRIHTGEKPYSCKICGHSFTRCESLKKHMRIHTGEKPYSCETCRQSFYQSGNLKIHMRIHTGERPYACETCGKCFTESSNLTRHLKTHR
ncbi:uncharacterized protein KZ484_026075 isoform 1-T1 [Pholidichthys leucotaenia]